MDKENIRSTIGLRRSTKAKLDKSRAPGQCYDGFLCQLVDMWDEEHKNIKGGCSRVNKNYRSGQSPIINERSN